MTLSWSACPNCRCPNCLRVGPNPSVWLGQEANSHERKSALPHKNPQLSNSSTEQYWLSGRGRRKSLINSVAEILGALESAESLPETNPLEVCVELGANPNEVDPETGNTPLTTIATACKAKTTAPAVEAIEILLQSGANPYIHTGKDPKKANSFKKLMPKQDLSLANQNVEWQYWVDDNVDSKETRWYPYTKEASPKVEKAFIEWLESGDEGRSRMLGVKSNYFSYDVHFAEFHQVNQETNKRRKIRRYTQNDKHLVLMKRQHREMVYQSEVKLQDDVKLGFGHWQDCFHVAYAHKFTVHPL